MGRSRTSGVESLRINAAAAIRCSGPGALASSSGEPTRPSDLDPPGGETPSKELRHAEHRRSCGGLSLVAVDGDWAGIYPFRCHRWRCSDCGARKVDQTRKRIRAGLERGEIWFITLTSPGDETPDVSFDQLSRRWKALHLRLTRRIGHVEYLAVVEVQRRGSPHVHLLVRGPLVPRSWLAKAAVDVGFGRILDIRPSHGGIAGYLTKAIGPNTSGDSLPVHFRRVRWSRGWTLPVVWRAKRVWQAWHVAFAGTARAAVSAVHRGYRIAELIHGPPERRRSVRPVGWWLLASLRDGWGPRP
jgi:hypothetical protein